MKNIIFIIIALTLLVGPVCNLSAAATSNYEKDLPIYRGSINDPGVKILEINDDYIIIEVDGEYYIIPK